MAKRKTGPLSPAEKEYILANAHRTSVASLAEKLNRTERLVREFVADHYVPLGNEDDPENIEKSIRSELRNSHEWGRLSLEFTPEELQLFEEKYVKLMGQFKNDVLASEETQILHSIKLEVLMSRNLIARRQAIEEMAALEKRIQDFHRKHRGETLEGEDRDYLLRLEDLVQSMRMAESNRTTEYKQLHGEYKGLVKDMKATRDQRIREVENSKESFLGLLKALQQRDRTESMGRQNELMKMAAEKELGRLSAYHTYEDGGVDRPFLSAETLEEE